MKIEEQKTNKPNTHIHVRNNMYVPLYQNLLKTAVALSVFV